MEPACEGGACGVAKPVSAGAPPAGGKAGPADKVVVFSRAICGLCWICRWHFWSAGLEYEVHDVDADQSWGAAIDRNGYAGGTFKLPVVVHGEKAWWDIKDHAAVAQELKGRLAAAQ